MSFCPICNNSYNINKSVNISTLQKGGKLNEEEIINQIMDKKVVESQILSSIDLNKLVNKPYYKKLSHRDKEYVYNVISHQQKKISEPEGKITKKINSDRAYFQCTKCGNQELIKPKTLIFSNILSNKIQGEILKDTTYIIHDKTLPRTKDYICENKQCITHKNLDKKEAVFFRHKKSYKIIYICTVCKTKWNL